MSQREADRLTRFGKLTPAEIPHGEMKKPAYPKIALFVS